MRLRISQHRQDLDNLGEYAWPTVRNDNRQSTPGPSARVYKMDLVALDRGTELGEFVECCLLGGPIETRLPVVHDAFQDTRAQSPDPSQCR